MLSENILTMKISRFTVVGIFCLGKSSLFYPVTKFLCVNDYVVDAVTFTVLMSIDLQYTKLGKSLLS